MSGVVYLLAGAGPSTTRADVRYHHDCVQATGKRRPRIAYVGAAADDDARFARFASDLVFGPDADVVRVELTRKRRPTSELRSALADADLVFLAGGDVERGMRHIDERGLTPYLRELGGQGKVFEGISAGSILLGRHWVRFPAGDDERAEPFACLGIVPASFDTHDEDDDWGELRALARLLPGRSDERTVYGIASGACAVWKDGGLRALGRALVRFSCEAGGSRLEDLGV